MTNEQAASRAVTFSKRALRHAENLVDEPDNIQFAMKASRWGNEVVEVLKPMIDAAGSGEQQRGGDDKKRPPGGGPG